MARHNISVAAQEAKRKRDQRIRKFHYKVGELDFFFWIARLQWMGPLESFRTATAGTQGGPELSDLVGKVSSTAWQDTHLKKYICAENYEFQKVFFFLLHWFHSCFRFCFPFRDSRSPSRAHSRSRSRSHSPVRASSRSRSASPSSHSRARSRYRSRSRSPLPSPPRSLSPPSPRASLPQHTRFSFFSY